MCDMQSLGKMGIGGATGALGGYGDYMKAKSLNQNSVQPSMNSGQLAKNINNRLFPNKTAGAPGPTGGPNSTQAPQSSSGSPAPTGAPSIAGNMGAMPGFKYRPQALPGDDEEENNLMKKMFGQGGGQGPSF